MRSVLACTALLACGPSLAEVFIDVGGNTSRIESDLSGRPDTITTSDSGLHFGVGARRSFGDRSDISVRLEIDDIDASTMIAVRAFDYRFNVSDKLALTAFFGAARLDLATPAFGYYFGGGVQWKDVLTGWDLALDARYGDKIARDNLLPSDPQGGRPDNFYDVTGFSLYLSRRF